MTIFINASGYLERFGGELAQNRSNKENNYVQNGYINGTRETSTTVDGDLHKKLLVILSNIGYIIIILFHALHNNE